MAAATPCPRRTAWPRTQRTWLPYSQGWPRSPVVVVGHSMGGFVSLVLANQFPERVRSLVLVDGGLPLQVPEGLSDDEIITSVLGPAAERLNATFPSREVYRSFWRQHPAFSTDWGPFVDAYVDYDLTGEEPELRPATRYEAMAEDTADLHRGASLLKALDELSVDAEVLRAPRGLLNEPAGLYAPGYLESWAEKLPTLTVQEVPDVNHYTIIMGEPGARAVAETVQAALARG
nr:alpha/beta fold hydrolase [Arthrobacter sp. B3I4]